MNAIDVSYDITGPDDEPVLVLSNSLGSTGAMWDPQVPTLAERLRVVRYEHRGHGGSPVPPGPYSLDDLGADALARLPDDVSVIPQYADITDQLERKITGVRIYESQIDRLFEGTKEMASATRAYARTIAGLGDVDGAAERYWVTRRV